MREKTKIRTLELAKGYLESHEKFKISLRTYADFINIPFTTIRDLFHRVLPEIDLNISNQIEEILKNNIHDSKILKLEISEKLREKVLWVSNLFIEINSKDYLTIRNFSKEIGISKSTIHDYLSKYLPEIDSELSLEVQDILNYNKKIGQEYLNYYLKNMAEQNIENPKEM